MKKPVKHIHRRIWLAPTDEDSQAWAAYTINKYSVKDGSGDMEISIADCFRHIDLSLHSDSKSDLRKIERLIKFLQDAVAKHIEVRDA